VIVKIYARPSFPFFSLYEKREKWKGKAYWYILTGEWASIETESESLRAGRMATNKGNDIAGEPELRSLYIDLMQRCLTNTIYEDPPQDQWSGDKYDANLRHRGLDWPSKAHTMIGAQRMGNLRKLTEFVIARGIPGDFIETGAWRGGACIFMRAILKAYGVTDRVVWCADSFEGLPLRQIWLARRTGEISQGLVQRHAAWSPHRESFHIALGRRYVPIDRRGA